MKEIDNGKTLGELRFKSNETLSGYKKSFYSQNKVPLLKADGNTLTERAKKIFQSWF